MKRLALVGLLVLSTTIAFAGDDEDEKVQPDVAKNFKMTNIFGSKMEIDFFKDKVILHIWGTWSPPCVEEFPDILELMNKNPDIFMLALSDGSPKEELWNFLKYIDYDKKKTTHQMLIAIGSEGKDDLADGYYKLDGHPTTIFI